MLTLSTDSESIRKIVADAGLVTDYRRPDKLATDTAGKIDALYDVLLYEEAKKKIKYDFLLDLDVTSPLRTVEDLTNAYAQLSGVPKALNIFSVSPAGRNPYFNMVEALADGTVDLVKRPNVPFATRQSAPDVYDMNASFYIYRRSFFDAGSTSAITRVSLAYVVPHQCFDLDEPLDFDIMEYLIDNDKLDFDWCG